MVYDCGSGFAERVCIPGLPVKGRGVDDDKGRLDRGFDGGVSGESRMPTGRRTRTRFFPRFSRHAMGHICRRSFMEGRKS